MQTKTMEFSDWEIFMLHLKRLTQKNCDFRNYSKYWAPNRQGRISRVLSPFKTNKTNKGSKVPVILQLKNYLK